MLSVVAGNNETKQQSQPRRCVIIIIQDEVSKLIEFEKKNGWILSSSNYAAGFLSNLKNFETL